MAATTDQYDRVKELFSSVCDLGVRERALVLDRKCGADQALRDEVETLLRLRDAGPTTSLRLPGEPDVPPAIGRYRVLREIGRGGMGVVYLGVAQDDQLRHPVAIKVLERGMNTAAILRRFDLEWHLMAALNHPGLVRLYEGGQTSDGLPYFTMEYVEGEPIDQYCDTHRLRIDERLELFRQVCAAVHHAHQNLVIHRDLKPSHILVSASGVAKVLDFSIARLIMPQLSIVGDPPALGDTRVMTLQYASPEQVRGHPLTTSSDIYALGIILYQLVTGVRPYRVESRTRSQLERVIGETEPERPSSAATPELAIHAGEHDRGGLRRRLAGDVDHIVLKALCKEPQRRYQSAAQFAEDIRRHLAHRPVTARPDTTGYRCVKFLRRNRTGVIIAAIIAAVLGTWGYSVRRLWAADTEQSRLVTEERDRTRRMLDRALGFANAAIFDLHDEIDHLDGSLAARETLVAAALDCFDGLATDVGSDRALMTQLAFGYDRIGDIQGGTRNPSAGDVTAATESYRAGLRLREELRRMLPDDPRIRQQLAASHMHIGDMRLKAGDLDGARYAYWRHLRLVEVQAPAHDRDVMLAHDNIAAVLYRQGDLEGAKRYYDRTLATRELRLLAEPEDEVALRDLATGLARSGAVLEALGDDESALHRYERALEEREKLMDADAPHGRDRRDRAWARYAVASQLLRLDRAGEAAEHVRRCMAILEERAAGPAADAQARCDLAAGRVLQGRVLAATGDAEGAMERFRESRAAIEALARQKPDDPRYQAMLAECHERIGQVAEQSGDPSGALESYRRAIEVVQPLVSGGEVLERQEQLARVHRALARVQLETGDAPAAENTLESARTLYESLHAAQPRHADCCLGLAATLYDLSRVRAARGYADEFRALLTCALGLVQSMPDRRADALRGAITAALAEPP